jgi:hypothetical protein
MGQYDLPNKNKRTELKAPPVTPTVPVQIPVPAVPAAGPVRGDPRGLTAFIRETAAKYGVDPAVALRVAKSEGLSSFQSGVFKNGVQEPSYGAFQLYTGGGLVNQFQKDTGLDPADPKNEKATIEYALKHASQNGWGPWYGAKNTGIGEFEGIGGGGAATAAADPLADPAGNTSSGSTTGVPAIATVSTDTSTPGGDTTTSDDKPKDKKKKDYGDLAGDTVSDIGKLFAEGPVAKNAARASSPATVPLTPTSSAMQGTVPMTDPKVADMQRQQLAMALQRLNSRRLA